MVVRDKPVSVESRLIPPHPKSNALSATYQRCCASLRVDRTLNHRFSSAESPRLDIHHSVENSQPFVQLVFARSLTIGSVERGRVRPSVKTRLGLCQASAAARQTG